MTKGEYLNILSQQLKCLPAEEFKNTMEYYEEYFAEAGRDNESKVIEELGNPEKLAQKILNDNGYSNYTMPESKENVENTQTISSTGIPDGVKIAIILITSPLWFGILVGIIGVIAGFLGATIACGVAGAIMIAAAFEMVFTSFATSVLLLGAALIVLAIAILLLMAFVGGCYIVMQIIKSVFANKTKIAV